jgi:exopolysaccharide production protein ExoQ
MDQLRANIAPTSAVWVRDDGQSLVIGAMLWALVVLMVVPESFDYVGLATLGAPAEGAWPSRLLWALLLGFGASVLLRRAGLAWLLGRTLNPFLVLFVALAVTSIAWSVEPSLSARRLVRMVTIVLVCTAFVLTGWHARRYQGVLRPIVTLLLIGSIVFGIVSPPLAIHQDSAVELAGAWHGLASHKNGLGALACLAMILWLHAWLTGDAGRWQALAGGGVAMACLWLSRSSTALVSAAFVAALMVSLLNAPARLRAYVPIIIAAMVALLLIYSLAILNLVPGLGILLSPVAELTDKTATMTGRTDIWWIINEHIRVRPLFGTGYAAYWTAQPVYGADSYAFIERMGSFYPGSAHNGYLDVANDLGLTGVVVLFGYIVAHVRQSLQLLRIDRSQAVLYLAVFFQQALSNLSESHWFSVRSVDFVVMTLATTALGRGLLEYRLRLAFGTVAESAVAEPLVGATPILPAREASAPPAD